MTKTTEKDSIKVDGWKVYNLPIKYEEKDYDEARAEVIKKAKNTPELAALFEYGCIPFLGISDMDFWAVFPDNAEKMYVSTDPILTEKTKHLIMHDIIIIPEKHYRRMLYLDPWTTYAWPNGHKLLYKRNDIERDMNFEKLNFNKEEKDILSMMHVEDALTAIYSAVPMYAKKELNVRAVFEEIKNCVYIAEEIESVIGKKIGQTFSKDFEELRENWFNLDQGQAIRLLIEIFYEGLLVGFEASFCLGDWVSQRSQIEKTKDIGIKRINLLNHSSLDKKWKNVYLSTFKDKRLYTDMVKDPKQALELSINSYKKININLGWRSKSTDVSIIFLPLELATTILGFASQDGLLSDSLKRDMFTNTNELYVFNPKIFQEKTKMINDITENYNRKLVPATSGKGWISGNNHFGYSFEREKIRRKLLTYWLRINYWRIIDKTVKN